MLKYNLGDFVFYIKQNRIFRGKIGKREYIDSRDTNAKYIIHKAKYWLFDGTSLGVLQKRSFKETKLFSTKQEADDNLIISKELKKNKKRE